jgi:elongation factor 2
VKKLSGENFHKEKMMKWQTICENKYGKKLKRGFVVFIMDPLYQVFDAVMTDNRETLGKIMSQMGIRITSDQRALKDKGLLKVVMQN